jgi:hypothetical protein
MPDDDFVDALLDLYSLTWIEASTAEAIIEAKRAGLLDELTGTPAPAEDA